MSKLEGNLSLYGLTMVAIGACIGSGIFLSPSLVAGYLSSPLLILLVWGLGLLHALTGSLTFAELGAMLPKAGGQYAYLKEIFGPLVAFLYAWVTFVVINGSGIAALSLTFAKYTAFIVRLSPTGTLVLGAAAIAVMAAVNVVGTKFSDLAAKIFSGLKLGGLALIIGVGLFMGSPARTGIRLNFHSVSTTDPGIGWAGAFGLAFVGVYFSVGGWQHASYLAGEARNPRRTVPRAMILGAIVVGLVYWLANLGYLFLLPVGRIAGSSGVAADALQTVLPFGAILIAIMISLSALGTVGINTYSVPRIFYALADDGLFFPAFARVHPRFKTPANAIVLQSAWAVVLLLVWGTFANIITYLVFMDGIFMLLTGIGIMKLRRTRPTADRPYRTLGYPLTPILFILMSLFFVGATLLEKPVQALAACGACLLGLPFYFYFRGKKRAAERLSA
ncbi:MAG: amino acid permease [Candidatus Aminicenantes bacterium]|nr:amino acid permease [Candidatus Aminicenantes bacterium]